MADCYDSSAMTAAAREIRSVYGNGAISERTCIRWISKFRSGERSTFDLQDQPRSGRPSDFNDESLLFEVKEDPKLTCRELAVKHNCSPKTIHNHLRSAGLVSKLGQWVPHQLTQANIDNRFRIVTELRNRYRNDSAMMDAIVTGDEKWVLYANVVRKRQWVPKGTEPTHTPKAGLHPKKILLSLFWDTEGVIHYEFVKGSITAAVYCEQLQRLNDALEEKRPNRERVLLLHDNARPHTAQLTQAKIEELGWEVLPHPAYSPDLAPTDFKAFRSLQNWLNGKTFETEEQVKEAVKNWINSKSSGFWVRGINDLPNRWEQVIEHEGDYFPGY